MIDNLSVIVSDAGIIVPPNAAIDMHMSVDIRASTHIVMCMGHVWLDLYACSHRRIQTLMPMTANNLYLWPI